MPFYITSQTTIETARPFSVYAYSPWLYPHEGLDTSSMSMGAFYTFTPDA